MLSVLVHNFNYRSDSGPNSFAKSLFESMLLDYEIEFGIDPETKFDIEFCLIQEVFKKTKPRITRLDGIYFNSDQDYNLQNKLIKKTYDSSDAVVFQTDFNKNLIETWFGKHSKSYVIRNAANKKFISKIKPLENETLDRFSEVWCCASSWRPHKRLNKNIEYFLEKAPNDACLVIAGKNAEQWMINHNRIFYVGHLNKNQLISLYKKSKKFIHLAWLDHCPNVVVNAQASGCEIICSSSGGTKEIVNKGIIINEKEWDFLPVKLYNPPEIDFNNYKIINVEENIVDISDQAKKYYEAMIELCK